MHRTVSQFAAAIVAASSLTIAILAADTYTGVISVSPAIVHQGGSGSALTETLSSVFTWSLSAVSTNPANVGALYVVNGSVAANSTNTVDLYGSVNNSFGAVLNMARVKGLIFCPSNSLGKACYIRPAAANGMTNIWEGAQGSVVNSGGCLALFAKDTVGYPVSNAAVDSIEIAGTATNATTYSLYILGQ
jgi:hypothetical protein